MTIAEVPTEERIPVGTVVKCIHDNPGFDARKGQEYIVEAYVPADEGDAEPPQPYYALATMPGDPWSSDTYAGVSDLQIVRTRAEQAEKMSYLVDDVLKLIQDGLMSAYGGDFDVYESERLNSAPASGSLAAEFEGEHNLESGVEFYARRKGGVAIGCVIRITALWTTDD